MKIHIVMVEPEIPQNTGNVARTCSATGAKLHLVKPLGFEINDKQLKRAGLDYWDKLEIEEHENLEAFLNKYAYDNNGKGQVQDMPLQPLDEELSMKSNNHVGDAPMGVPQINSNVFLVSTKSQHVYSEFDYTKYNEVFFLFGKETKGLPEVLIEPNLKQAIRIPMKEGLRSLNLSNSVAIVVYEALRQNNFNELQQISNYFV